MTIPGEIAGSDPRWNAMRSIRLRHLDTDSVAELPQPPFPLPASPAALVELAATAALSEALSTAVLLMVAHRVQGSFTHAKVYTDLAESLIRAGTVARAADITEQVPVALLQIGITRMFGADLTGARSSLIEALEKAPTSSRTHVLPDSAIKLALIASFSGDLAEGKRLRERGPVPADLSDWLRSQLGFNDMLFRIISSQASFDEEDAARALTELGGEAELDVHWLKRRYGPAWASAVEHLRARQDLLWGDRRAALWRLRTHREALSRWLGADAIADALLRRDEIDLLLCVGATERARSLIEAAPSSPQFTATRARLELLTGRNEAAAAQCRRALDLGEVPPENLLQLLVIRAVAHDRLGHTEQADASFEQAVRTVRTTHNAFGLIAAPRASVLELAARSPLRDQLEPFLSRLPDVYPSFLHAVSLSGMESRVLAALSRGLTVSTMAREFFLSPNTVKSHVHRIYRKLGVTSRDEAITRADELGLLRK